MNGVLKKAGLAVALGATALTAAVPADAQYYRGGYGDGYRGHYRGRGDTTGAALLGGVAGLVIGAAIASGNNGNRDYYYRERGYNAYYDDNYYRGHGYYPNNGYYAYTYRDRGYDRCRIERRWDPYYEEPVRVRVCY